LFDKKPQESELAIFKVTIIGYLNIRVDDNDVLEGTSLTQAAFPAMVTVSFSVWSIYSPEQTFDLKFLLKLQSL
jgi:hypothetical protein